MQIKTRFAAVLFCSLAIACGGNESISKQPLNAFSAKRAEAPIPTPVVPKNGDYPGTGKVTKINVELGSVELDHEEIEEVMPKMIMEFFVSDKKLLSGLKPGDVIDFTLRYKDGQETIIDVKKK